MAGMVRGLLTALLLFGAAPLSFGSVPPVSPETGLGEAGAEAARCVGHAVASEAVYGGKVFVKLKDAYAYYRKTKEAGSARFDAKALEGQARQQKMLEDNKGYNVSRWHGEKHPEMGNPNPKDAIYPEGGHAFLTDRKAFEKVLGKLPENGGTVTITRQQADRLARELGMTPDQIDTGSVIRQVEHVRDLNPASPIRVNDSEFRGAGHHLPSGSPELTINPAQPKANNPNITREWKLEVKE